MRQGSKRNYDSVSVEELDWLLDGFAESQVLIPAEHLWCDFKCRPWAKIHHQTPITCTYGYSHIIHFKTVATEVQIQMLSTLISLFTLQQGFWPTSPYRSSPHLSGLAEKNPQTMLHGWMVFLGLYSSFFFLQTRHKWSLYQNFIFWSHMTTWPSPLPPNTKS